MMHAEVEAAVRCAAASVDYQILSIRKYRPFLSVGVPVSSVSCTGELLSIAGINIELVTLIVIGEREGVSFYVRITSY